MERIWLLLFMFVGSFSSFAYGLKKDKLALMDEALVEHSPRPFVTLTNANQSTFLEHGPRNYDTVLMLTVESPRFNCQACRDADVIFDQLAHSYERWRKYNPQEAENSTRIVFMKADYEFANKVFEAHELTTAPVLTFLERTNLKGKKGPKMEVQASFSSFSSLESFQNFIKDRNDVTFPILADPASKQSVLFTVAVVSATLFGFFGQGSISKLVKLPTRKGFWMAVCISVYLVSISGAVFCIIRGKPVVQVSKGEVTFFEWQDRTQMYGEGMIIALLNSLFAVGIIGAVRGKWATPKMYRRSRYAALVVNAIGLLLFVALCMYAAKTFTMLHTKKTGWYSFERVASHVFGSSPNSLISSAVVKFRKMVGKKSFKQLSGYLDAIKQVVNKLWVS